MAYFLYTRDNPHAPKRANGKKFWGYPERTGGLKAIKVIGVHTGEISPSPASAESIGRYLRDQAAVPASYHYTNDSDSEVDLLPDEAVAFGIGKFNTSVLQMSFATRAGWWGRFPMWDNDALLLASRKAGKWVEKYDIPVRWLNSSEARNGSKGFVRHSTMDPSRRSDPGSGFPYVKFFALIKGSLEDDMALTDSEKKALALIPKIADDLKVVKQKIGDRENAGVLTDLGRLRRDYRRDQIARGIDPEVIES